MRAWNLVRAAARLRCAPARPTSRAFCAEKPPQERLRLQAAAVSIPHPDKVAKGGEDAHFIIEPSERPHLSAIGVADGVGGWADQGVDPGVYSAELMRHARARLLKAPIPCPQDAIAFAHTMTKFLGSCTACALILDGGDKLKTVNLGDSGFLIAREGEGGQLRVVYKSPFGQHDFNTPKQLSTMGVDMPWHGDCQTLGVRTGDLLVAGTDGLWDNAYDADVLEALEKGGGVEEAAERVARLASSLAAKTSGPSPFADAGLQHGFNVPGGKMDDITVIVARVEALPAGGG